MRQPKTMTTPELLSQLEQIKNLSGGWASGRRRVVLKELELRKQKGGNQNESNRMEDRS